MQFGEFCRFKNRSQESLANVSGGSRFHSGIFLGIDSRTGQYMIYSDDAVKQARTVVRVPMLHKWNKSLLADVRMTPYALHTPGETEVIFKDRVEGADDAPAAAANVARQLYLKPDDFVGP